MATIINASRIGNGALIVFTAFTPEHGGSRKLFVQTDALLAWLNDENTPFDFSVCGMTDFLRISRGTHGMIYACITTMVYRDEDTFTGWHVYAELPESFFTDLLNAGCSQILARDPFAKPQLLIG